MSAKNKRIKPDTIRTRADFDAHADRVTFIDTELRRLKAERDAAVQLAQKTHAATIGELEAEQKTKAALCLAYATEQRSTLFSDKAKSAVTAHSRFGFRVGNHTLVTLSKWTWAKVLAALDARNLADYIRQKPEVNKDAILDAAKTTGVLPIRDGNGAEIEVKLGEIGLRIEQEESFYIEPLVADGAKIKAEAA